ncbi:putative rab5-interacting protein family [Helianthus debilis subsp. tardiflorus]
MHHVVALIAERQGSTCTNWLLSDQLGDVLHWIRQIVALVCGLLWGAIPLVGGIWLVTFLVISSGIIYGYYAIILKVDEEEFGGHGPLLQEGLFASVTLFLVHQLIPLFASAYFIKITDFLQLLRFFFQLAWTLVYSLAHF